VLRPGTWQLANNCPNKIRRMPRSKSNIELQSAKAIQLHPNYHQHSIRVNNELPDGVGMRCVTLSTMTIYWPQTLFFGLTESAFANFSLIKRQVCTHLAGDSLRAHPLHCIELIKPTCSNFLIAISILTKVQCTPSRVTNPIQLGHQLSN
jgi:hypothetical protein